MSVTPALRIPSRVVDQDDVVGPFGGGDLVQADGTGSFRAISAASLIAAAGSTAVVIDNSTNPNALTDQQFEVTLDADSWDWSLVSADGSNLQFFDTDGTTPIPFNIDDRVWDWNSQVGRIVVKAPSIPPYTTARLPIGFDAVTAGASYDATLQQVDPTDARIYDYGDLRDADPSPGGHWPWRKGLLTAVNAHQRVDTNTVVAWSVDSSGGTEAGTGHHFAGSKSVQNVASTGTYYQKGWQISGMPMLPAFSISGDYKWTQNATPGRNGFRLFGWHDTATGKGILIQSDTENPNIESDFTALETSDNIVTRRPASGLWCRFLVVFELIVNSLIPEANGKYRQTFYLNGNYIGETADPLTMPDLSAAKMYFFSWHDGTDLRGDVKFDRPIVYQTGLTAEEVQQDWKAFKPGRGLGLQSRIVPFVGNPILEPVGNRPTAQEPQYFYQAGRAKPHRMWFTCDGVLCYTETDDPEVWPAGVETNVQAEHCGIADFGGYYYNFVPDAVAGLKIYRTPKTGNGLTFTDTGTTVPPLAWQTSVTPANTEHFTVGDTHCLIVEAENAAGKWQCELLTATDILGPYSASSAPSARLITLMTDAAYGASHASFSNFKLFALIGGVYHFWFHGSRRAGNSSIYHAWSTDPRVDANWQMETNPVGQTDRVWAVDQRADRGFGYDPESNRCLVLDSALNNGTSVVGRVYLSFFGGTPEQLLAPVTSIRQPQGSSAAAAVATDLSAHEADHANPHAVTAAQVGSYATAQVDTALALKAPLASPALTGTPTTPTAAAATNTTQIASCAFVRAEVAALVNSAPGTLDTLGEIATQLASDESAAAALATTVGTKASTASLTAHTGNTSNPHAVTAAQVGLGTSADVTHNTLTAGGSVTVGSAVTAGFRLADDGWKIFRDDTSNVGPQYSMVFRGTSDAAGSRQWVFHDTSDNVKRFGAEIGKVIGSSGTASGFYATPTINQSGSAGYNGLLVNVTESATGSGDKLLVNAQLAGATKFAVDRAGNIRTATAVAATTPGSVVKKIQIFDAAGTSLGFIPVYSAIT